MNRNDVALDTLAREELGLDPTHARFAVGRRRSRRSLAFAFGAALPVIPFLFGSGDRAHDRRRGALDASRCSPSARPRRSSPAATPARRARAWRSIGAVVALITFGVGKVVGQTV